MKIGFVLPSTDGECRCYKCGRLLAKIKAVNLFARIEIKCPRSRCGTLNVFDISKNEPSKKQRNPTRD